MADQFPEIKHVVLLMLENRSFDHLLGYVPHPDPLFDGLLKGGPHTNPPWHGQGDPIEVSDTSRSLGNECRYGVAMKLNLQLREALSRGPLRIPVQHASIG